MGGDTNSIISFASSDSGVGTVPNGDQITVSWQARTQTGITAIPTVAVQVLIKDAAGSLSTFSASPTMIGTIDGTMRRFTYKHTVNDANASQVSISLGATSGIGNGDTLDFEITEPQAEVGKFATSFIPTGSAIGTRNADVPRYANKATRNRTSANETIFIKAIRLFAANDPAADVVLLASDTKDRRIEINVNGTFSAFGNNTDSSGSVATFSGTVTKHTSKVCAVALQGSGNPNAASYIHGSADGSTNTDFTAPAWSPTDSNAVWWKLGYDNAGANGFAGIIQAITIHGQTLDATKGAAVTALL